MKCAITLLLLCGVALAGCDNDGFREGECWYICCQAVTPSGRIVDCTALSACDTEDVEARLACCECQPDRWCTGDPACAPEPPTPPPAPVASSCMSCHNGARADDYSGPGLMDPHPFGSARLIACQTCHGGNPESMDPVQAHVPRPLDIGDDPGLADDPWAYRQFLGLTGVDRLPSYDVAGQRYEAIDWLQFINPGDLRVVARGRGCGLAGCHADDHGRWLPGSIMATSAGIQAAIMDSVGVDNAIVEYQGWYQDTAAEYGFRAIEDDAFPGPDASIGRVGRLLELPENAVFGDPTGIFNNPAYTASAIEDDVVAQSTGDVHANQLLTGSALHDLVQETVSLACGGCHLGDRGSPLGAGEFRATGCTACHMRYTISGRAKNRDLQRATYEPINPDLIQPPERPHAQVHRIDRVAGVLPSGDVIRGIADPTCGACHRETNDTVVQFWGVRVDRNRDLTYGRQYPVDNQNYRIANRDHRLFDISIANDTYQGYGEDHYIEFEDYDDDGLDDTPPDIHHQRGLGCIDCHGGRDVHGGADQDPTSGAIMSRQEQVVGIACESCHGDIDRYAPTRQCITREGTQAECVHDRFGNVLPHVTRDARGDYWLRSRLDATLHYVTQTRDVVVDSGKLHPVENRPLYNARASYAMGRADGDPATGLGPAQMGMPPSGFSHSDRMDCVSCHATWSNHELGRHLAISYRDDPQAYAFSTVTGERIVLALERKQVVYATPIPLILGVDARGKITQTTPGIQLFFQYQRDLDGAASRVFAFSDRRGNGNNPGYLGRGRYAALGYERIMPHTIRGRVDAENEGPRYCVSCHLTTRQMQNFGVPYQQFYDTMKAGDVGTLDFALLRRHIGENPGNQLDSPFFVHMAAGLGTGLFFFDANGCPVNPLDISPDRTNCNGVPPIDAFDSSRMVFALDRVVEDTGVANASSHRPALDPSVAELRDGALEPGRTGPLGSTLVRKLADPQSGLVLDSWLDAAGTAQGGAADFLE